MLDHRNSDSPKIFISLTATRFKLVKVKNYVRKESQKLIMITLKKLKQSKTIISSTTTRNNKARELFTLFRLAVGLIFIAIFMFRPLYTLTFFS